MSKNTVCGFLGFDLNNLFNYGQQGKQDMLID